jgi:hypothetical protein
MKDTKQRGSASLFTIWTDACIDGEPARISIVNGAAKIRMYGLTGVLPGQFAEGAIADVVAAEKKQVEEIDAAFDALPDGRPPSWGPHDGLDAFDDIDLAELEEDSCEVVYLNEVRRGD